MLMLYSPQNVVAEQNFDDMFFLCGLRVMGNVRILA